MRHKRSILVASAIAVAVLATTGVVGCHPSFAAYHGFEIREPRPPATTPPEKTLTAQFLGVSTILLYDGETAIMTDGFFSRPGFFSVFFSGIHLHRIRPNTDRIDWALTKANRDDPGRRVSAVLVAHAHYDHGMDSPIVARKTYAQLVGSSSVAKIAAGQNFADTLSVKDGDMRAFKRFTIRVIASPHTPDAHYPGVITQPVRTPAFVGDYKEGGSFSFLIEHEGLRVLIHPSTNYTPHALDGVKADVVFLGTALLGKQSERFRLNYWREVVHATGAKLVIPIHWDDFFTPINEPLVPMRWLIDDFKTGTDWVLQMAEADGVKVRFIRTFTPIDLLKEAGRSP